MDQRRERDAYIVALRQKGHTLDEIGLEVNLTRERVRQIIKAMGGPTPQDYRTAKRAQAEARRKEIQLDVTEYLQTRGGATMKEIARALNITEAQASQSIPQNLKSRIIPVARPSNRSYTNDAILEALRSASTYEWPLTGKKYNALVKNHTVVGPSSLGIIKRFGSWTNACDIAGVESGSAPAKRTYQSQWTDNELLEHVRDYLNSDLHHGTYTGYEIWRLTETQTRPSGPTLRNQLGKWSDIKRRALVDEP